MSQVHYDFSSRFTIYGSKGESQIWARRGGECTRQNGTCPWEQTGDAFMRFKSPKRSISSVMHYSPVPRGTLNVLCARSSSPSSRSFFFFHLSWLSSSTRQSSRRVSFQLPEDREDSDDESAARTFCRLISAIAVYYHFPYNRNPGE